VLLNAVWGQACNRISKIFDANIAWITSLVSKYLIYCKLKLKFLSTFFESLANNANYPGARVYVKNTKDKLFKSKNSKNSTASSLLLNDLLSRFT
jgi:hypothetical protein